MAIWPEKYEMGVRIEEDSSLDNILMTDDLQECIEDFELPTFGKVFEQLPVYTTSKLSDENNPETSTYVGQIEGHDENDG